jgi:hypothetical protein
VSIKILELNASEHKEKRRKKDGRMRNRGVIHTY